MQKCLKFQSQSKILKNNILVLGFVGILILISPQIFTEAAGDISSFSNFSEEEKKNRLGEIIEIPLDQQKLKFEIGKESDVRVKHVIEFGGWAENEPRMIKILPGIHSNVDVTDIDGYSLAYTWEGETFEKSEYVILQQKLKGYELILEYDLKNFLDNIDGVWTKDISFPVNVEMSLSDDIEILFVNSRPVDVLEADGINCMGCNMKLEFLDDEEPNIKKIIDDEIKVWSNGKISELKFTKEIKELYFQTEKNNQLVTLEIPLKLMLYPFEVYFTEDNDNILDQIDKIRNTEFSHNDKSVKVSIRSDNIGNISIIGATQNIYEQAASKIIQEQVIEEVEEVEEVEKPETIEKINVEEIYENWDETHGNTQDNTIVFVIIGIIVVVGIIVGIIIKLKK